MSVPILPLEGVMLVSIQDALEDTSALQLKAELLEALRARTAHGILIDMTGADIVDSFAARIIGNIANAAGLLGARTVLVGLQPEVAMTMVELDIELRGVETELNVDRGLQLLHRPG